MSKAIRVEIEFESGITLRLSGEEANKYILGQKMADIYLKNKGIKIDPPAWEIDLDPVEREA